MPDNSSKTRYYSSLSPRSNNGGISRTEDLSTLRPSSILSDQPQASPAQEVKNLHKRESESPNLRPETLVTADRPEPGNVSSASERSDQSSDPKQKKRLEKDKKLLKADRWLARNGHLVTYFGLYMFSILVLVRPYELVGALSFLAATAFYFALATLMVYLPSQMAAESNLTIMTTEIKAILAMTVLAVLTIPIAKDPGLAWEKFNDPYIKAVIIFVIMVNVLRTRKRLLGMVWLSIGIGGYLSIAALDMYFKGQFTVESYRVAVEVGVLFGNPNEMAMHFVMMTPLAITLGIVAKNKLFRLFCFALALLLVLANMVTFSRGGFLGLLAVGAVLAWKLGRKQRLNVSIASIVIGGAIILAAPGNYGLRMLSIFIPGLDPVGSSDQRKELLQLSLLVTARNPWGIGIGNFPIVGIHNLQSHNAFTQVSSELGILGLVAYLVFIISPFRKLAAIERKQFDANDLDWFYFMAIGFQASIIGYLVSSFFASVAYNWFIYYLIAYAVAFRRIYSIDRGVEEDVEVRPLWEWKAA